MNLLWLALLWLGGWLVIILLFTASNALSRNNLEWNTSSERNGIIEDANNLFSTGIFYFIGNVACFFINNSIVHWILFVLGVLFAIVPCISALGLIPQSIFKQPPLTILFDIFIPRRVRVIFLLTAIINAYVPLLMALNILFNYILKS